MPFEKSEQPSFIENQKSIEKEWDKTFQDRKNEIVVNRVEIKKEKIYSELESCLLTEEELRQKIGKKDTRMIGQFES